MIHHGRYLQTSTSSVQVYFGINTNTNSDSSYATIQAQANTSALITALNLNIAGLPTLLASSLNSLVTQGVNDFNAAIKIGTGPNYIYIHQATLTSNGLIYAIIGDNAVWTT